MELNNIFQPEHGRSLVDGECPSHQPIEEHVQVYEFLLDCGAAPAIDQYGLPYRACENYGYKHASLEPQKLFACYSGVQRIYFRYLEKSIL